MAAALLLAALLARPADSRETLEARFRTIAASAGEPGDRGEVASRREKAIAEIGRAALDYWMR